MKRVIELSGFVVLLIIVMGVTWMIADVFYRIMFDV